MFGAIFLFMSTIVFFMVVVSSANTMLMTVFERTREIGLHAGHGHPAPVDRGPVSSPRGSSRAPRAACGVLLAAA